MNESEEFESCIWKAEYTDQAAIDKERQNAGPVAWERGYKLKVVAVEIAPIKPEDIHYYDELSKSVASITTTPKMSRCEKLRHNVNGFNCDLHLSGFRLHGRRVLNPNKKLHKLIFCVQKAFRQAW